jgi:hypothetical protein
VELVYNPTRIVSSAELGLTCDPIEFEVKTSVLRPVRRQLARFEESNYSDAGLACELAGLVFVAWSQNGQKYPFDRETAEALRAQINDQEPGAGDEFICALVDGFIGNHYGFFLDPDRRTRRADPGRPALAGEPAG